MLPAADQGDLGTCWAFASLAAVETSMAEEDRARLSADHMIWQNGFGTGTDGGDYGMAMAYLLAWKGPVLEEQDPYWGRDVAGGPGAGLPRTGDPDFAGKGLRGDQAGGSMSTAAWESAVYIPADFGKTGAENSKRENFGRGRRFATRELRRRTTIS